MEAEMAAMKRLGVFTYVARHLVPVGVKIISCRWVFKVKPEKLKSRLVIRGFLQDISGIETFSPTLKMVTLRLMMALAAFLGWQVGTLDARVSSGIFVEAGLADTIHGELLVHQDLAEA